MSTLAPYSKLRDHQRPQLGPLLPLALPFGLFIEPTNVCNFKCRFCPESFDEYEKTVGGKARLDFALFTRIVQEIKAMGRIKVVRFYMLGEPLLSPDLIPMIAMINQEGIADRTELTTNGSALTAAKSRQLIEAGLDYLRVSIYAATPERSKHVTQSNVPVEKIHENVRTFRRIREEMGATKPVLYVKMIDSFQPEENEAFLRMYADLADECVLEKPMNWNGAGSRDLLETVYEEDAARDAMHSTELFPYRKDVCPMPFYNMVINANGDVTACCVDWNKKTIVGNLHEESFNDVWQGARFQELRRLHLERRRSENESCKNCTYLYTLPDNLDGLSAEDHQRVLKRIAV